MEGDLQPLYLLLTDCYIYLLRKGKRQKTVCRGFDFFVFSNALCNVLTCVDIRES